MSVVFDVAPNTSLKESLRTSVRESGENLNLKREFEAEEKIDKLMEGMVYNPQSHSQLCSHSTMLVTCKSVGRYRVKKKKSVLAKKI